MWSNLALYPSFQVGNTCSALVHCLYGGYNLHRFSDVLGLVETYLHADLAIYKVRLATLTISSVSTN